MQRVETEPFYGKDVFVQMRHHYKQKFEQGLVVNEVIAIWGTFDYNLAIIFYYYLTS